MYVQVRLLNGYSKPLIYKTSTQKNLINRIIKVPLRNKILPAIVTQIYEKVNLDFKVREISSVEPFPCDDNYDKYISQVSRIYFTDKLYLYKRIQEFLNLKTTTDKEPKSLSSRQVKLTDEQQNVVNYLSPIIKNPHYAPTLVHGVTGSGKTEVYIKLIKQAISENKSVIIMVPEVSLCMQFQGRLQERLPNLVYSFHSASKTSERKSLWKRLVDGVPTVILGVHLPILLPIQRLGLIIVDEEHEVNYQEKKHPKLKSRDLAILRASMYKIPILLGSATPSLHSLYSVKHRNWKFFQLKKRFSGNFPVVEKALLEKGRRKSFWITKKLENEIQKTIDRNEQVLIFINRRGYNSFLMCKECSYIFECPECSVSLTVHKNENEILKCHYCAFNKEVDKQCPDCKTGSSNFLRKGIGTQQAVTILQKIFPSARIRRADLDTTTKKREWSETVRLCQEGGLDILVGTQSITKGYHFPKVTLVGVLWADMGLHFPMYNAHEIAIQQLLQVSGRAGRASDHSKVILQMMSDHPLFDYTSEVDYPKFYDQEIELRADLNYPPLCSFTCIEIKNTNAYKVDTESDLLFKKLNQLKEDGTVILGPVKPTVFKIQKAQMRHVYIKTASFKETVNLISKVNLNNFNSSISVVPS